MSRLPPPVRPKQEQDPLRIAAGSPLAIQGIFLEILRERFKADANLSWVWNEDPTRSSILIESSYADELEARNAVPAIYVTRLQSQPQKVDVGDRTGVHLPDHLEGFGALMNVAMQLECVSNDEGESAIVGDVVQFTLLASEDVIRKTFDFYELTHPVLGRTSPFERDQTKWVTPIDFTVSFWIRWTQVPIAPLLQQISQRVAIQGTDIFKETVLTSIRRGTPNGR